MITIGKFRLSYYANRVSMKYGTMYGTDWNSGTECQINIPDLI